MSVRVALFVAVGVVGLSAQPAIGQDAPDISPAAIDEIFESFNTTHTPGCAVGVSSAGRVVLERAYGMADLEHDVANRPGTVFEPGSVTKQVTAAATMLLVMDGAVSLDDDVRMYIPELPIYEAPITIRHLIHHTSGLRDWGSITTLDGWPRGTRAYRQLDILEIASRQEALNYRPGDHYSYTNTGYSLQFSLIERVTGMGFAEFTKQRLFEPLGMKHTQWRDDFTRVVKDRAVAYGPTRDGWRMMMPFENTVGAGGLLTTVGDLLRWTRNLDTGAVGGSRFVELMHERGVLNSGQEIAYAAGLREGQYRGAREVSHSGTTGGYRGFLTRFPEQELAVAVICNAASADTERMSHAVADLFLGDQVRDEEISTADLPQAQLEARAGRYRDTRTGALVLVETADGGLRMEGAMYRPVSPDRFEAGSGQALDFTPGQSRATVETPTGPHTLEPVEEFEPTGADLMVYAGTYRSPEIEIDWTVESDGDALVFTNRYGARVPVAPIYPDVFFGAGTAVTFLRNNEGEVEGLRLGMARAWDVRFERAP